MERGTAGTELPVTRNKGMNNHMWIEFKINQRAVFHKRFIAGNQIGTVFPL